MRKPPKKLVNRIYKLHASKWNEFKTNDFRSENKKVAKLLGQTFRLFKRRDRKAEKPFVKKTLVKIYQFNSETLCKRLTV